MPCQGLLHNRTQGLQALGFGHDAEHDHTLQALGPQVVHEPAVLDVVLKIFLLEGVQMLHGLAENVHLFAKSVNVDQGRRQLPQHIEPAPAQHFRQGMAMQRLG